MNAGHVVRECRLRAGLTLRSLAERSGTSHATISAYETGRKVPNVETLDRIVRAAGYEIDISLARRVRSTLVGSNRGDELAAVLDLAEAFPVRHDHELTTPIFGRR
jgi:transcriptional regulator with XRE-family HTH domain